MNYSLKREMILRGKEIKGMLRSKRTVIEDFVFYTKDEGPLRFAVLVKKKLGKAYIRNKIKRWCRETYRVRKESLPHQLMILVRKRINSIKEVEHAFDKISFR